MDIEEKLMKIMLNRARKEKEKWWLEKGDNIEEWGDFDKSYYEHCIKDVTRVALTNANQRINCGGYALKFDGCLFPNGDTFAGYVSSLLDRYDFIRLLGDKPLQDDEYLVFYRISEFEENNEKNEGHHFVRVDSDGLVVDKCGGLTPRIFPGWNERYIDSPEAVFAVKKEHDDLFEKTGILRGESSFLDKGLDFEGAVSKAISEENNIFEYHCHTFKLKKSTDEDIFVTKEDGEIVAEVLTDGVDIAVGIKEGKEDYVENYSGPVKPIIENGRLVNLDEFRKPKEEQEIEK